MTELQRTLLKVAAVLWVVWGGLHLMAGLMSMSHGLAAAVQQLAEGTGLNVVQQCVYPPSSGAGLEEHGRNLTWLGAAIILAGCFVWRAHSLAIWMAALVGGMVDVGYFVLTDLPGQLSLGVGVVTALLSGSAIALSFWVWRSQVADSRLKHRPRVRGLPRRPQGTGTAGLHSA